MCRVYHWRCAVASYVLHHRDGTVRMDWYTFRKLHPDKVMRTVEANAKVRPARKPHRLSNAEGVKQYA